MKKLISGFVISLSLTIIIFYPLKGASQSATTQTEIRGVWITKNDSDVWLDGKKLSESMRELASLNFNTVYPVVWNSGYVAYDSEVAKRVGIPIIKGKSNWDIVAEIVYQAHRNGLLVIPWFEFGFMTPPTSELAIYHPQWLTSRRDGSLISETGAGEVVWLNPFHPEVQQLIIDLVVEICSRYQVDGIQFDDHLALPRDFGYDAYTVSLYREETNKNPPANFQEEEWVKWRADKITDFMLRLRQRLKQINPRLIVSLAPNPYRQAYNFSLQDWQRWVDLGIVDELVIQVYRDDLASFVRELNQPEVQKAKQKIPTGVAILTGLRNKPTPITLVENKVREARRNGLGVAFFYYETLWWGKPGETPDLRKAVIRALFYQPMPRFPLSRISKSL
ncbi:MAG: glycoside hydrolase family 10 protein [Geminocystis sp.]|nr:family 10 glycosylhydrolase [Geminocystis sp.]MDW8463465.1 glycoside hydrolase family 10 protein [Geminocystis sp.]HIK36979.1 glycoside hydrolase family 10 protein [Geminocystis sp. M7585_C2015_104]